jgi:hypothetical protein
MRLIGIMLARNEDWVIGLSARAALMWCDELVVMLHCCRDATFATLTNVLTENDAGRVYVAFDRNPEWEEMRLREEMLSQARKHGATHIAIIDADEVLTGNALAEVRTMTEILPDGVCLQVPWFQLKGGVIGISHMASAYMSSGMWAHQNSVVAFKDNPAFHWASRDGYDFHHRQPMGLPFTSHHMYNDRAAGCMHLQFLSRRRLIAKQFLYQLMERKRWGYDTESIKKKYVPTVTESDSAQLAACPESWWAPYSHLMQYLHIDREPWQEEECFRLIRENPGIEAGLDDFGLLARVGR